MPHLLLRIFDLNLRGEVYEVLLLFCFLHHFQSHLQPSAGISCGSFDVDLTSWTCLLNLVSLEVCLWPHWPHEFKHRHFFTSLIVVLNRSKSLSWLPWILVYPMKYIQSISFWLNQKNKWKPNKHLDTCATSPNKILNQPSSQKQALQYSKMRPLLSLVQQRQITCMWYCNAESSSCYPTRIYFNKIHSLFSLSSLSSPSVSSMWCQFTLPEEEKSAFTLQSWLK